MLRSKKHLIDVINTFLDPIRTRRQEYAKNPTAIMKILFEGIEHVHAIAQQTMKEVREAMSLDYKNKTII